MNYLSSKELSEKWGITQCRIIKLAREGRISGAKLYGRTWIFPENAVKPIDARTKSGKIIKAQETDTYRYPSFEYRDPDAFNPPLNEEERRLKSATEAFYACRYEEADRILGDLEETTTDKYRRICALYTGCMIDIFLCRTEKYFSRYDRLMAECRGDFTHQAEMEQYLYQLDAFLGSNGYYGKTFKIQPNYPYHESFLSRLANLSAISLAFAEKQPTASDLTPYEMICLFLEKHGAPTDVQAIHISLGIIYGAKKMTGEMTYHLKKALELAQEYNMFFMLIDNYYLFPAAFDSVLADFPKSFRDKIIRLTKDGHHRFDQFLKMTDHKNIYNVMLSKDYIYLHCAVMGLSNRAIAAHLHLSEPTVSKRFNRIYDYLGIKTKPELVELYHRSVHGDIPENVPAENDPAENDPAENSPVEE